MASTLLNPGCDTCYDCVACDNFSGTWYIWYLGYRRSLFTDWASSEFINAFPLWTGSYYWATSNLADLFDGVLASFTFPGTEPSAVVGGKDKYVIPTTYFTGLEATDTLEYRRFGSPVRYGTRYIRFYDFSFEGYILYDPVTKERALYNKTKFKVQEQPLSYSPVVPLQEFQTTAALGSYWPCRTDPLPPADSGNESTNFRTDSAASPAASEPLQVEMEGISIDVLFPLEFGPPYTAYSGRAAIGTIPP